MCLESPCEDMRSLQATVTGGYELPALGAANPTWVLRTEIWSLAGTVFTTEPLLTSFLESSNQY